MEKSNSFLNNTPDPVIDEASVSLNSNYNVPMALTGNSLLSAQPCQGSFRMLKKKKKSSEYVGMHVCLCV
jgi:hypothetical protein